MRELSIVYATVAVLALAKFGYSSYQYVRERELRAAIGQGGFALTGLLVAIAGWLDYVDTGTVIQYVILGLTVAIWLCLGHLAKRWFPEGKLPEHHKK